MHRSRHRDDWNSQSWKTEVKSPFTPEEPSRSTRLPQTPQECSIVHVRESLYRAETHLKKGIQEAGRLCRQPDSLKCIFEGFSLLFQKRARELKLSGQGKISSALESFKRHVAVFLPVMLEDFFNRFVIYLNESEEHSSSAGANGSHSISNTSDREGAFGTDQTRRPINWNQARSGAHREDQKSKPAPLFDGDLGFEDEQEGSKSKGSKDTKQEAPNVAQRISKDEFKSENVNVKSSQIKRLSSSKKTSEDDFRGPVLRMTSFRNFQTNIPGIRSSPLKKEKSHLNQISAKNAKPKKEGFVMNPRLNSSAAIERADSIKERAGAGQRTSRSQKRKDELNRPNNSKALQGGLDTNLNWGGFGFNTEEAMPTSNLYLAKNTSLNLKKLGKRGVSEEISRGEYKVSNAGKKGSQPSDGSQTQTVNSTSNGNNESARARVFTNGGSENNHENRNIQVLEADGMTMTNASNPSASNDQMRLLNMSSILPQNQQSDFEQGIDSPHGLGIYITQEITRKETDLGSFLYGTREKGGDHQPYIKGGWQHRDETRDNKEFYNSDQVLSKNALYGIQKETVGKTAMSGTETINYELLVKKKNPTNQIWGHDHTLPDSHIKPFDESGEKLCEENQSRTKNNLIQSLQKSLNQNFENQTLLEKSRKLDFPNSKLEGRTEPYEKREMKAVDYFKPNLNIESQQNKKPAGQSEVSKEATLPMINFDILSDQKKSVRTERSLEKSIFKNTHEKIRPKIIECKINNSEINSQPKIMKNKKIENRSSPFGLKTEESIESEYRDQRKKKLLENRDGLKGAINNYFTKKFGVKGKKKKRKKKKKKRGKQEYGMQMSLQKDPKNLTQDCFVSAYESREGHQSQMVNFSKMNMTVGGESLMKPEMKVELSSRAGSRDDKCYQTSHGLHHVSNLSNLISEGHGLSHITNKSLGVPVPGHITDLSQVETPNPMKSVTPRTHKNVRSYLTSKNLKSQYRDGNNQSSWYKTEGKKSYNPNSSACTRVRSPLSKITPGFCFKGGKTPKGNSFKPKAIVKIMPTHKLDPKKIKRTNLAFCLGKSNSTVKHGTRGLGKVSRNQSQAIKSKNNSIQSVRNKSMKRFGRGLRLNLSYKERKKKSQNQRKKLPNSGKGISYGKSANNSHRKRGSDHVSNSKFLKLSGKSSKYKLKKERLIKKSHFKPKIKHKKTGDSILKKETQRESQKSEKQDFTKKGVPKLRDRFKCDIGQIKLKQSGRQTSREDQAVKTVGKSESGPDTDSCPMNFQDFQGMMVGDLSGRGKISKFATRHIIQNATNQNEIERGFGVLQQTRHQIETNRGSKRATAHDFENEENIMDNGRTKGANERKKTFQSELHDDSSHEKSEFKISNLGFGQKNSERKSSVGRNNRKFWQKMRWEAELSGIEAVGDNIIYNMDSQKFAMAKSDLYSKNETEEESDQHYQDNQIVIPNFGIRNPGKQIDSRAQPRVSDGQLKQTDQPQNDLFTMQLSSPLFAKEVQEPDMKEPPNQSSPDRQTPIAQNLNQSQNLQIRRRVSERPYDQISPIRHDHFSSSSESLKIQKKQVKIDFDIFKSNDASLPATPPGGLSNPKRRGMESQYREREETQTPTGKVGKFGDRQRKKGSDIFKKWKKDLRGRGKIGDKKVRENNRGRSAVGLGHRSSKGKSSRLFGAKVKRG